MKDLYKIPENFLFDDKTNRLIQSKRIKISSSLEKDTHLTEDDRDQEISRKINAFKESLIRKRLVILSYESWGNRLRGATAWSEIVNTPDVVSKRKIKPELGDKQGLGHIISTQKKKNPSS